MFNLLIIVAILVLFYLLGKSADLIIVNIRQIGEKIGIKIFFLGLILGFLTTLPELSIGISSVINNIENASLGNLLGGPLVLFGLILGFSIILNRKIKTDGKIMNFLPVVLFLLMPLFLGLDGSLGYVDGVIILIAYTLLIFFFYKTNKSLEKIDSMPIKSSEIAKNSFMSLVGMVLLIGISNLIVRLVLMLLQGVHIPELILGVLLFSIGTNLPEIIIAIRSWKKNIEDLSFSNLIGSASANMLVVGIFSIMKPFNFAVDIEYVTLLVFSTLLMIALAIFYRTDKEFSRREGVIAIATFIMFFVSQIILLLFFLR